MEEVTKEEELLYVLYWIWNTLNDPDEITGSFEEQLRTMLVERNLVLKVIEKYLFADG